MTDLTGGLGVALGFLVGILGHEYVQHRVAFARGDKTPKLMGRLTLSPKAHTDPIGTLVAPGIFVLAAVFSGIIRPMFGWGKTHSLNEYSLRNPKRDGVIVALAGPATNAVLAAILGRAAGSMGLASTGGRLLGMAALVNVFIAVLEILPIPGRDGARVLARFLSPAGAAKLEELSKYGILFLVVLFILPFLAAIVNGMAAAACEPLMGFPC